MSTAAQTPQAAQFRREILDYFESVRCPDRPYGSFRYAAGQSQPTVYASVYAAMARHLLNAMGSVDAEKRRQWAAYIQSFQDEDGLFKEPQLAHEGSWYVPPHMEWCGWLHLTTHVIIALTALGATAAREFALLRRFYDPDALRAWLRARDFDRAAFVGNEVMNLGVLFQYARDFQNVSAAGPAMEILLDWLDETQDPGTGLWGNAFDTPERMDSAYQAAYHFYPLYEYDRRPIRCAEAIIDSMLAMQTPQGGFGIRENTSGCEDIDAMDPLARMFFRTRHRRDDVRHALERAIGRVLENRTADGSFAFIKDSEFFYGSRFLYARRGEGSTFCAWWRTLSLAIATRVVTDHPLAGVPWRFPHCPGYEFWPGAGDRAFGLPPSRAIV